MILNLFAAVLLLTHFVASIPQPIQDARSLSSSIVTFDQRTIFSPPDDYRNPRVLYGRSTILSDGSLLATWENYSPEPVYFPIYHSTDEGQSWTHISNLTDQVNGWGMRYQPFLYTLPSDFGGFTAGTVLCAGNSIPANLSNTQIDLYASTDNGCTWSFVSHIASGGEALPDDGLTPVWEPFLQLYNDEMVVFYSDQRDPAHAQKLVHQTSLDLMSWGEVVDDVAFANYSARPGMTTVSQLSNGNWFMTFEYGGAPGFVNYSFPVYYKISDSPLTFNEVNATQLISTDGTMPQSSPYNVFTSYGGNNGSIIVNSATQTQLFINTALGDPGCWESRDVPEAAAYTRNLKVLDDENGYLMILGAGELSMNNTVSNAVVQL